MGIDTRGMNYRIVVAGTLGKGAEDWFGDAIIHSLNDQTVLDVSVPDQSALHGILRRIHDLHLQLVSVTPFDLDLPSIDADTSS
jgi:hypothetical protein